MRERGEAKRAMNATTIARVIAAGAKKGALMSVLMGVLMLTLIASSAQGQDRRGPRRMGGFGGPEWWGSAWAGYQWSNPVGDPTTKSVWDFDSNWSMRLTAEREVAPRTTMGLVFNYARLPLTIAGGQSATSCRTGCLAEATMASYGLMARSGGGPGLHLVYEGFAGALRYSNFTLTRGTAPEYAGMKNTDFTWSFGTGLGYGIGRDFELSAMFDYGTSVHEKSSDLFQQRTTRHYTTRVGLRVGL